MSYLVLGVMYIVALLFIYAILKVASDYDRVIDDLWEDPGHEELAESERDKDLELVSVQDSKS